MDNCDITPGQNSKATYDPGWNDPPKFAYSAQQTTPNRPRNFLNKRVAFPMSNTTNPVPQTPVNMPPIQMTPPTLAPNSSLISEEEEIHVNSENTLQEVKSVLLNLLESSTELDSKSNDVKRRISAMEEMWLNGKLNKSIHIQMKDLASALKDNDPHRADDIHRALMVDHVSAVGSWMPGVKLLIRHCIARSELLAIDKE